MGEVFHAVHLERNLPVAIKILNARRARDPEFRTALRQEIRAVARLHHPGVIMVFDCGDVPAEIEEKTHQRFIEGSSWLAMELASYSLQDVDRAALDWWHVRNILVRILDALSHSHARGVIHRDLKPANVLFVEGRDGRQIRLTDYGLAHALDEPPEQDFLARKISGTPRFMSPEQITGQWRDHGPWTDLYALGCMAYWLVDGEPPFSGENTDEILESHLTAPLPPLHAPFDVPLDFGIWLGRLLAKSPSDRYERAADAARALFAMGDPPDAVRPSNQPPLQFQSALDASVADLGDASDMGMTEIISEVMAPSMPELRALERPGSRPRLRQPREKTPIPLTWHRKEPPPISADLVGVGLGLFGLREIPFVGRHQERDRIWEALQQVARRSLPEVILLRGPTGTGKTRLSRWIGERAHELGAATPLHVNHGPMAGSHDGLAAMFADHLRCTGLDREGILERVRGTIVDDLDPDILHDCLALTEIIAPMVVPDYSEEDARIRFRNPEERHAVMLRFLQRFSRNRPLILIVDDLQWGTETISAVEYLLASARQSSLSVLILGTVQTDALVDRPVARQRLQELEHHREVTTLPVGPLPEEEHRELIKRLLTLDAPLVDEVAQRTAGNPLYAVQLVGDWVERGVLELSLAGFRLRPGDAAPLPANLQEVFRDRLAKLVRHDLDGPPSNALLALELAAVLGTEVQRREWSSTCTRSGLRLPLLVIDAMASNDLVQLHPQGWNFQHQAFRETLLHTADNGGRLATHHFRCATSLRHLYPPDHPGLAARLARHYLAARHWDEALEPLLAAAEDARIKCEFDVAYAYYDQAEECLRHLQADEDDPRRARIWIQRAETLIRQTDLTTADELLSRAEALARVHAREDLLASTLVQRAAVANRRGKIPQGMPLIKEALRLYRANKNTTGRARAMITLADLHYWAGEHYDAERAYQKALQLNQRIGNTLDAARVEMALGSLYTVLGDMEKGQELLEHARDVFEEIGDLNEVANCANNLGELFRTQGDLDRAEAAYLESQAISHRIGVHDDIVIQLNLGMVYLTKNDVEKAGERFRTILKLTEDSERRGYLAFAHIANLPLAAHREDWQSWDHHIHQGRHHLAATSFVDADVARLARDAGERAMIAGQPGRARHALLIARSQWLSMGRQDRAAEIDRLLPP